jgi:threonine synthase
MSYLTHLKCSICQRKFDPHQVQTYCSACNAPLLACYDLAAASRELDRDQYKTRPQSMWRWRELLPVFDPDAIITLGEGDAPLLPLPRLGSLYQLPHLYLKDESFNPTGSFKARGLSAAVSKAFELGIEKLIIPTAGNAGGALAAYAARAGLKSTIIMPKDSPLANIEESRITGADVILVEGLISDAAKLAGEKARLEGWFDISTFKEPYRTEGKKIMGYELAESFQWTLPDVIIYPTGGGTGLIGMWKAFAEMEEMGWLASPKKPRMISVQSSGCAPVVKSFESGAATCEFWQDAQTIASGLRVPKSFADRLILHDIRESNGLAVGVDDTDIVAAQKLLAATEGVFAAPEGAATLAALIKLRQMGEIMPDDNVVLFNTAAGLKYLNQ